jgi:tRNA (adenine37-N6)-methyltransferase
MDPPNEPITCRPIGVIRTPHTDSARTPRQPQHALGIEGRVEVDPQFEAGLAGIERLSHIVLLFAFDRARTAHLTVTPPHDGVTRGVFATRSPSRPNPLGLSVVRLLRRQGRFLYVADVDLLDGTPILDIKPHIADPRFDPPTPGDRVLAAS